MSFAYAYRIVSAKLPSFSGGNPMQARLGRWILILALACVFLLPALALAPGVRASSPDIGGSNMTEQVSLRAHGLSGVDGEQLVEGMSIQSYEGASQSYFDDMLQSEISVMTAAIPADTTGGGIRLNSILKD